MRCALFRNACGGLRVGINFDAAVRLRACHIADNTGHAVFSDLADPARQQFLLEQYESALALYEAEVAERVKRRDARRLARAESSSLSSSMPTDAVGNSNDGEDGNDHQNEDGQDAEDEDEEENAVPEPRRPYTAPPRVFECVVANNVDISDPRPDRHRLTRTMLTTSNGRMQSAQLDLASVVASPATSSGLATSATASAPASSAPLPSASASAAFAFVKLDTQLEQGFAQRLCFDAAVAAPLRSLPWSDRHECAYCLNPAVAVQSSGASGSVGYSHSSVVASNQPGHESTDNATATHSPAVGARATPVSDSAASDSSSSSSSPSSSLTSSSLASSLVLCSRCARVRYCNRECQRAHWRRHRPFCWSTPDEASLPLLLTLAPTATAAPIDDDDQPRTNNGDGKGTEAEWGARTGTSHATGFVDADMSAEARERERERAAAAAEMDRIDAERLRALRESSNGALLPAHLSAAPRAPSPSPSSAPSLATAAAAASANATDAVAALSRRVSSMASATGSRKKVVPSAADTADAPSSSSSRAAEQRDGEHVFIVRIETDLANFDAEDPRQPLRVSFVLPDSAIDAAVAGGCHIDTSASNESSSDVSLGGSRSRRHRPQIATLTVSSPPLFHFVAQCGLQDAVNVTARRVHCFAHFDHAKAPPTRAERERVAKRAAAGRRDRDPEAGVVVPHYSSRGAGTHAAEASDEASTAAATTVETLGTSGESESGVGAGLAALMGDDIAVWRMRFLLDRVAPFQSW